MPQFGWSPFYDVPKAYFLLLGDVAAVSAMLDRLLHHGHVLKCGPRSWRTKAATSVGGGQ